MFCSTQSQLERVTATSLSVDSLTARFTSLQAEVEQSSDRIQQLTRLLKLEQAYSGKVKEEITKRVLDVGATVNQWRDEHVQDRAEQRRQREERDEMERRERAERQQRETQMQAVVADMELRLDALQRQADEDRRQREQDRRDSTDSRHHTDERISLLTQQSDETTKRMESIVRMMTIMDDRNRADDERRRHDEQQWQVDMTAAREQQRSQLMKCASDLRAFQLSIRGEMSRRERQLGVMKKAVLMMSEELDRAGGGGGGVAGEEVRRWREEERREREERDRRRQREEMDKLRDDLYRYIDTRISSLPPPPPPPQVPLPARLTSGYERDRAERVNSFDNVRWAERSMERLVDELATGRERERVKATGVPVERGVYKDGARGRSAAAATTLGGSRAFSGGVSSTAPLGVRQRGAPPSNHRPTRAGIGR